jgi:Cep192 domain 4/Abnormal spindle-like microcephaly-assoc'd, ASPM-SPD-2-Hydin
MLGISPQPRYRGLSLYSAYFSNLFLLACSIGLSQFSSGCASGSAGKESPAAAKVSIVPASVDFKEVVIGQKNSQTVQISNTGDEPISFEALRVSGSGFTLSPVKTPLTLPAGKSFRVTIVFSPAKESPAAGSLALSSSNLEAPVSVPLAGSGEKTAPQLQSNPSSLSFGTVAVHTTATQTVNLKNTGNVPLTINSAALSNSAFSTAGLSSGVSLAPGQSLEFKLAFRPTSTGSVSGTLSIGSSSLASPVNLAISGAGTSATTSTPSPVSGHSVSLVWSPSSSSVVGYHVYRGTVSGGPYSRVTANTIGGLDFSDTTVASAGRYYYVVTALNSAGEESAFSNEAAVDFPNP